MKEKTVTYVHSLRSFRKLWASLKGGGYERCAKMGFGNNYFCGCYSCVFEKNGHVLNIMKRFRFISVNKGFAFLEILLVLAIILFLGSKLLNQYLNKPVVDKQTRELLTSQGIDTSSYKATTDSFRAKVNDITKQHLKELDDITRSYH